MIIPATVYFHIEMVKEHRKLKLFLYFETYQISNVQVITEKKTSQHLK